MGHWTLTARGGSGNPDSGEIGKTGTAHQVKSTENMCKRQGHQDSSGRPTEAVGG